jgi:hypothetical protein
MQDYVLGNSQPSPLSKLDFWKREPQVPTRALVPSRRTGAPAGVLAGSSDLSFKKAEAPHLGESCGAAFCKWPVSRILSRTIIPLGDALLRRSSDLPGGFPPSRRAGIGTLVSAPGQHASAAWVWPADSLPIWSCSVWGLPCHRLYRRRGALLPHLFTLTPGGKARGGMFSVALAVFEP